MRNREADSTDRVIRETRVQREALHALIERLAQDHREWIKRAHALGRRVGLTAAHRHVFRAHLARMKARHRP